MKKPCEGIVDLEPVDPDEEYSSIRLKKRADSPPSARLPIRDNDNAVIVGLITGFDESGLPLVDFPENETGRAIVARSTILLSAARIGTDVVMVFDRGDLRKPIILGCIQSQSDFAENRSRDARIDGEKFVLSAEREIVLSCGKASITLTRAGKIIVRGAYVVSQSSGVNCIKGGSVQIN